ncbi:class I tRNA ligase family protein [Glycomyces xiaoerkulensis]|uniref:class I tRNA ligase family protein n=1 Tax=Glycomyces xiaoerkulensis TaxID=2038139 RepID=UPI000C259963|nr:class I tRNA ligase family protein [Glycomyces xiaoerkulensis]
MILDYFDQNTYGEAFGIDVAEVQGLGVGAGWGRVAPGTTSTWHQHDETEFFLFVSGRGELCVDGRAHPVRPGTVALFEPFESHTVTNTGDEDLILFTQYWRGPRRAEASARSTTRPSPVGRPQFVCSPTVTPNGDLHLGHLSGPYLGADVYVRFQRLLGNEAWHVSGSDDYQCYVTARARREGIEPSEVASRYATEIQQTLRAMDIVPDQFTRTSEAEGYRESLRGCFARLTASGRVRPSATLALRDGGSGEYLYEAKVAGKCPACGELTGGNGCEECGVPNLVADLVDPVSKLGGAPPVPDEVERYSIDVHELADEIVDHHRKGRVPARAREVTARFLARKNLDIALTHPSTWGVEPADSALPGQTVWSWPETAFGFLYSIGRIGERLGRPWRADRPERDWKMVMFLGFDHAVYSTVLWPMMYRTAFPDWHPDIDYHLNEFYLLDGEKFSTSRRHAIWGREILTPETVDSVRFYLCLTRPEGERTNFVRSEYETFTESVLIGRWETWLTDLGRRVEDRYGAIPDAGTWTDEHTAFYADLNRRLEAITAALSPDRFSPRRAAAELCDLVDDAREFSRTQELLSELDTWSSEARTAVALELAAARLLATGTAALVPRLSDRLHRALGLDPLERWPEVVELVEPGNRCDLASARIVPAASGADRSPVM